jgi:uncharacterized membrane protein YraQ (UPF0718 family)
MTERLSPALSEALSRADAAAGPPSSLRARRRLLQLLLALATWALVYARLEVLASWLTFGLLGLDRRSSLSAAVEFFLYEAPKVLMLLALIVLGVGIVRSFFTAERTRRALAGKGQGAGNLLAGLLGVVTPFCSCSAVPLFIGFVTAGVPLGVTFSFLIAAPMVNEVALALLFALFGWRVAALYLASGLSIAIVAGMVIGRLRLERWVEPWVHGIDTTAAVSEAGMTWEDRLRLGVVAVKDIGGKVWPFVLAGIAVGAGIHGYVPQDLLAAFMGRDAWWSVPLAVLIGIPLYSNAAGMMPVAQALLGKGAALGTVLAFMMSTTALSLPEMVILRKVLAGRLIAVLVGVVGLGILAVGYLFNVLL